MTGFAYWDITSFVGVTAFYKTIISDIRRNKVPHVIIKMYPGRTEEQKSRLVRAIVGDIVDIAKCEEKSVSVAVQEVDPKDWAEAVYKPDILDNKDTLMIKPGYNPFD